MCLNSYVTEIKLCVFVYVCVVCGVWCVCVGVCVCVCGVCGVCVVCVSVCVCGV